MPTREHDPRTRNHPMSNEAGLLRDDELEFIVGGLDRPVVLPHELERPTRHLSPLDVREG